MEMHVFSRNNKEKNKTLWYDIEIFFFFLALQFNRIYNK